MKNGVREVAKLAKVSIGTVSNVLNRPEVVSADALERVNAAMKELGYEAGTRKKGRRVLAFGETTQGKALIDQVSTSGVEVMDLEDESKREQVLRYLLNNKSAAAAILIVTQAGAMAEQLGNILN
jgi:LacI family transcriptional regulator